MSSNSNTVSSELAGARVLIMGLGAHGGGAASARFCAEAGADVTVTDLRTEEELAGGIASLSGLPIRYVLGRHEESDFRAADIVVKNPAVRRSVPLLRLARRIETDISLFLADHAGPVFAITGTKGKSTTASALHHILLEDHPAARLGGNITVSPLTFAADLTGSEPVVLELSSFQLGDLLLTPAGRARRLPGFAVSAVTNLMRDHQDYYGSMEPYAADKAVIFRDQGPRSWCLLSDEDEWTRAFEPPHPEHVIRFPRRLSAGRSSARSPDVAGRNEAAFEAGEGVLVLPADGVRAPLVPRRTRLGGEHMRTNLLFAGVAAYVFGVSPEVVRRRSAEFTGVAHRLEPVATIDGVAFVNDSAATIAEATAAALSSLPQPVHLIAGGSDKGVPIDAFTDIARAARSVHLLAGTATERIINMLEGHGLPYAGPYASLESALDAAVRDARAGEVVLLSPGCASFGMFLNEFDRGEQFRSLVQSRASMIE
ncbi:MAG: UDP-N-acetylmuramoyl-L-alanine--D-glutamate ligase [Spirochaetota bacterium]